MGVASLVIITVIVAVALGDKHPTQHLANVSYGTDSPSANVPLSKSNPTSQTPINGSNINQQITQEEAQSAQNEANEQQALNKDLSSEANLNNQTSPANNTNSVPVSAPTSAPNVWTTYSGNLFGTYYYAVSFVSSDGTETALGPVSLSVRPNSQQVWVDNLPTSSSNAVTERKVYRTTANGSMAGPFYLVTTINDNITTSYYDNVPDSSLPTYNPKYP